MAKKTPNAVDRQIGGNLRKFRMMRGKTQEWLGKEVNLTFQQIQKYEKGVNRIGGSRMVQFCQILGLAPEQLIGDIFSSVPPMHDYPGKMFETRAGLDLAVAWDRLSNRPEVQKRIVGLVEAIADNPQSEADRRAETSRNVDRIRAMAKGSLG